MKIPGHNKLLPFAVMAILLTSACKTSKSYNAEYEAAWQEVVKSDAWKSSLDENKVADLYADGSSDDNQWLSGNERVETVKDPFEVKYDSWVSSAYMKIIAEAEAADNEIKAEYDRFLAENPDAAVSTDENVQKIMRLYKRKYEAHKAMLDGLRSWHAMESYGSDDLKFFKEENRRAVKGMYSRGRDEEKIVDFLVYKLADLYHFE